MRDCLGITSSPTHANFHLLVEQSLLAWHNIVQWCVSLVLILRQLDL